MLRPRPLDSRLRGNDGLWVVSSAAQCDPRRVFRQLLNALHSHVCKRILVSPVRRIIKQDETHLIEIIVRFEELLHRIERDDRGLRDRITIHAGADRWKGNRLDVVLYCES